MIRRFINWLMLRRGQTTIESLYDQAEWRPATRDGEGVFVVPGPQGPRPTNIAPPPRRPRGRVD